MFEDAPPSAGEIRALAHQLLSWANHLSARPAIGRDMSEDEKDELVLRLATAAREAAHLRDRLFPEVAFGNPVWDIALELFIQEMNGHRITVERLPLIAYLPSETVDRCLDKLRRAGLVSVIADGTDPRQHWLTLSPAGKAKITQLLTESAGFLWPVSSDGDETPEPRASSAC